MIIKEQKQKRREWSKKYYQDNKERILKKQREWRENNIDRVIESRIKYNQSSKGKKIQKKWRDNPKVKKKRKERLKEYYKIPKVKEQDKIRMKGYVKENKIKLREYIKKYHEKRRKTDKGFQISNRLRNRLRGVLKKYIQEGKIITSKKYGIDYKAIIEHLKPFPKDVSKYHVDHIKPLCSFDLTNSNEVKKAFSPKNHQWLLVEENLAKISEDLKVSLRNNNH